MLRVVAADDSYLIREAVRQLLEDVPDIDLVGLRRDLPGLLQSVDEEAPDVVVTDIRMPPTNTTEGLDAAAVLRESHPDAGLIVLSNYDDPSFAVRLFEHGSRGRGYLVKERIANPEELLGAIRAVATGGSVVDPGVVDGLVGARAAGPSPLDPLTGREREVLGEMAQGKNNAGIAQSLVLSERAVEKHIGSIFSKLGLNAEDASTHRRVRAVLLYLEGA